MKFFSKDKEVHMASLRRGDNGSNPGIQGAEQGFKSLHSGKTSCKSFASDSHVLSLKCLSKEAEEGRVGNLLLGVGGGRETPWWLEVAWF